MSLIRQVRLAFFAPIGGGPPSTRDGSTLSNPIPMDPNRKYSASKYSRFKGNSNRLISHLGKTDSEFTVVEATRKRRITLTIMRPVVEEDDSSSMDDVVLMVA